MKGWIGEKNIKKSVVQFLDKLGIAFAEFRIASQKIKSLIPKVKFDPYSKENLKIKYPRLHRSYELSKQHFWNDTKVIDELLEKYGQPKIPPEDREAILKIFSIIYYGEVVAMIVAAQLVDMVPDIDAKKVLSAQVIEEAKHVTAYQRYLSMLGEIPDIDPNTKVILDDVMNTGLPALKIVGLHLLTETVAYYLFTAIKESYPEPVLRGILEYIALDEAKHVGFARKYLPEVVNRISLAQHIFVSLKGLEWMFHLVSAFLRLAPYGYSLGIDVPVWFDRATEDLIRLIYESTRKTKYSKLVLPESFLRNTKKLVGELLSAYSIYGKPAKDKQADRIQIQSLCS